MFISTYIYIYILVFPIGIPYWYYLLVFPIGGEWYRLVGNILWGGDAHKYLTEPLTYYQSPSSSILNEAPKYCNPDFC